MNEWNIFINGIKQMDWSSQRHFPSILMTANAYHHQRTPTREKLQIKIIKM